jgi:hypothetical protein
LEKLTYYKSTTYAYRAKLFSFTHLVLLLKLCMLQSISLLRQGAVWLAA